MRERRRMAVSRSAPYSPRKKGGSVSKTTTVGELENLVRGFCEERDWDQFHTPKELAVGIATEAAELLAMFRFLSDEETHGVLESDRRVEVENELADVMFFVLRFAQRFDVDLGLALERKIELNGQKYPVEKSKGRNLKYTDL